MSRLRRFVPSLSKATLVVNAGVGIFTAERILRSPNQSYHAHWREKHRDRAGWEGTLKTALLVHLHDEARTRTAQLAIAPTLVIGALPPAPQQRYRVEVTRTRPGHGITDDDNLVFSVKPLLDALKAIGVIFDDHRAWLDRPMPIQVVERHRAATIIRVSPWWRSAVTEAVS